MAAAAWSDGTLSALRDLVERPPPLPAPGDRGLPGERLDPADARGDAGLLHDGERADVTRARQCVPAAQLDADAGDRHDANPVAVLLAEQRHRAGRDGLVGGPHLGDAPGRSGQDAAR